MKIENSSLKIFLTSGVTITVNDDEEIKNIDGAEMDLGNLATLINDALEDKEALEFCAKIKHPYKNEEGKEEVQKVKHYYYIPYEKISWYIIEEV